MLLDPLGETITSAKLESPIAPRAIEQLISELSTPRAGSRPIVEQLLRLCLLLLLRMQHDEGRYPEWMLGSASSNLLEQVILKLIDMPEGDFSIDELSRMAGMSRSSFLRIFTETLGQSPGEFVRDLRLKQAARLLATTQRPIERVATAVGYESRSHFSKLFKSRYGVDPTEYRRNAQ
ncbi:transcriptional regulator GlxA family with amidase domain [Devosia sp. UYZn731]|uniref:AraC family transcriptional regulator n=1 Tax=Devosia sp. UYZn731 TaxID=3156345 RepID=UPI00339A2B29